MTSDKDPQEGDYADLSLARRITRLEEVEEIKQITYQYCRAIDMYDGYLEGHGKRVAACFTEDGVWDGGVLGRFEGAEGLAAFWDSEFQTRMMSMALHIAINPIISVKGDGATGKWHLSAQLIFGGEALWTAGQYDNSYQRTSVGWRIREMKYTPWMWSRHLEGWAKERFMDVGSLGGGR